MQWCQRLEADYGMDPWIWQSLMVHPLGVVVLASEKDGKVNLIAMATQEAMDKGAHAGNLIKAIAGKVGGGGGGRPNMAQAGGKNPAGILDAIAEAKIALEGQL